MEKILKCSICGDEGETTCTPEANCLNIPLEAERKLNVTAYHHWLMKFSNGDKRMIAALIRGNVVEEQNPQAFDLLSATGDKEYTIETFDKAADLVINSLTKTASNEQGLNKRS